MFYKEGADEAGRGAAKHTTPHHLCRLAGVPGRFGHIMAGPPYCQQPTIAQCDGYAKTVSKSMHRM
uniref:Uncharacterized protein n=1 Tax=viral metagenome TaxID=1070528 RepID=A0A6M3Y028_9ZZZZ